jgi:hypothetical protein
MFGQTLVGATVFLEFLVHEFPTAHMDIDHDELQDEIYLANHEFLSALRFVQPHAGDECCVLTKTSITQLCRVSPPSLGTARAHLIARQGWTPTYDAEIIATAADYLHFDDNLVQAHAAMKVGPLSSLMFRHHPAL